MSKQHFIKASRINNRCPECYSNEGLELKFYQLEKDTLLFTRLQQQVTTQLFCHTCNQNIVAGKWDVDIDRVYEYHLKALPKLTTKLTLKPLAYGLIILDVIVLGVIIWLLL